MPSAQYSSFDRGFDLGHTEVPSTKSPKIEREFSSRGPSGSPVKKILAFAMVAIMVASALVIVIPAMKKDKAPLAPGPNQDIPAKTTIGGQRKVNVTISNMFEEYPKPTNYALLGKQQGTVGFPQWWIERKTLGAYPDTIVHDTYPLTMMYDYYSANIPAAIKSPRMGYGVYSFFRQYIDAENLTTVATGPSKQVFFIPTWSTTTAGSSNYADDGGSVSWNWYITYLTNQECSDITAGTHYANTYYNVPTGAVTFQGSNANDGWWSETQGTITFDRAAAHKFLNLPKVGTDLVADFNANNTGNALGNRWAALYILNGSANAGYQGFNTYATYDYAIDSGQVLVYLSVDPSSTPTSLKVRMWGVCWGWEILWERYLDSQRLVPALGGKGAAVADFFQGYPEDFYLNGTASSNGADLHVRQTVVYKMLAWKDNSASSVWGPPAWNLPTEHTDACVNTLAIPPASWALKTMPLAPFRRNWSE